jgi:AcrR family transcriptional regulator
MALQLRVVKRPRPAYSGVMRNPRRGPRRTKEPKRRGQPVIRKVLEITLEQLAEVGFDRLSVPDVAVRAGVNKTSVYYRWPTKGDLVREALNASMECVLKAPDTGDLRSDLIGLVRGGAAFIESPRGRGIVRMLFAEGANPDVGALAVSMLRQEETKVPRAVINRAIRRGEAPVNAEVDLVLFTLVGALLHRVFVEQAAVSGSFIERLVDLLLYGMARGRSKARPTMLAVGLAPSAAPAKLPPTGLLAGCRRRGSQPATRAAT